jgi:hypothetical protein
VTAAVKDKGKERPPQSHSRSRSSSRSSELLTPPLIFKVITSHPSKILPVFFNIHDFSALQSMIPPKFQVKLGELPAMLPPEPDDVDYVTPRPRDLTPRATEKGADPPAKLSPRVVDVKPRAEAKGADPA